MIAVDTNVLIRALNGDKSNLVIRRAITAFSNDGIILPVVVVAEFYSWPEQLRSIISVLVEQLPTLPIAEGLWKRAGQLRSGILQAGRKCLLADALIAQQCMDEDITLATLDKDFRHFAEAGLKIIAD